jgi:hypothetical protein
VTQPPASSSDPDLIPPDLVTTHVGGPDFTSSGSTMRFGFFRDASTGHGGGEYTTVADTDN